MYKKTVELYHRKPLNSQLSREACEANRKRGEAGHLMVDQACAACKGVQGPTVTVHTVAEPPRERTFVPSIYGGLVYV